MDDSKKKKYIYGGLILAVILIPVTLLSNPVLGKYQSYLEERHKKLDEKFDRDEKGDNEEWETLKSRQQLLGDIYRITLRDEKAIDAYNKYHDWFDADWKSDEFLEVKFRLARLYEEVAKDNAVKRVEYEQKAACHYYRITKWYPDHNREYVKKAKTSLTLRLEKKARNCINR